MIVSVVGLPFSGRHTLASALSGLLAMRMVTHSDVVHAIDLGTTPSAAEARALVRRGELLPADIRTELFLETAGERDAILVGHPRSAAELESFVRRLRDVPAVIHLVADESFVDARTSAAALPRTAHAHPGALRRLESELQTVLDRAGERGRLLPLSAHLSIEEQVGLACAFIDQQRGNAR